MKVAISLVAWKDVPDKPGRFNINNYVKMIEVPDKTDVLSDKDIEKLAVDLMEKHYPSEDGWHQATILIISDQGVLQGLPE
jgi:hypothetical protein